MTIKDFKYFPFTLKLKNPFQTSKQLISERAGFIISLTDNLGSVGYGECSPLPGFSKESLEDAENNLSDLKSRLMNLTISGGLSAISDQLSALNLIPSIQFALEQSILSLFIKRNKNFIKDCFGNIKPEIEVNAVIGFDNTDNIFAKINEKIKNGYRTIKTKVGREYFEEDYQLIKKVRESFGDEFNIRLDANGKWELNEAKNNLQHLAAFNIQYIEEPSSEIINLEELANISPIPIAVDESIHSTDDALNIINSSKINFIIIKPMVTGGIISSYGLIKEAEKKNKHVIISSSFESAIGKSALVFLASLTKHSFAHGLDSSDFFERDICMDSYVVKDGKITFDATCYPPHFDLSL